ncbi:nuclear transport factor 2 family protein [Caenimonas koreensis]|uniref:Nuclear transport factor 2 family protein n=1 Tax=Caenimonas koreensis DSM 17982 TaxID=1121255 RepID=A0A844AQQ7_9BURK|nr:nuclear transport factor 2 family protein [Caenimonas koreensis]MRD46344.1 nuclear transport factor 2 family protein [Caenimonas koreensis DSM 17982]
MTMRISDADRIAEFFERFSRADLVRLQDAYVPDALFKDPFNEVRGLPAIEKIFRHMFDTLDDPKFVVRHRMSQGRECWLAWDMVFRFKSSKPGQQEVIRGASHLMLADDGRIAEHRDYWDAAEELYEKLPVLGALMRWLKRKIAT